MTGLSARRRNGSLTARLLLLLVLVQACVPVLGMAAWMLFSPYVTWTDVAAASAQRRMAASLEQAGPDGRLLLRPTEGLRAYAARRPGFAYGVLAGGTVAEGSSPALAGVLARLGPYLPSDGQLAVDLPEGGTRALFAADRWNGREVVFVTAGNRFGAEDLEGFVASYLPALVPIFGPSLLVAALAVPLVVRRTMRPLRLAAEQAGAIAFTSLSRRLPTKAVPREALPLVQAVNAALDRLAQGAERQRLFHANAAHELRTPVAILKARLDSMPDLPRGHELRRDVGRVALLVEQLLAVERVAACGAGTDRIDLVACVRDLVADCAPLAIRAGRMLEFEAAMPAAPVRGNGRALASAVANLIDNALRAEPEGGCVEVRVGPGAAVEVADHGTGVAAVDRLLVFEPFWRKDERPPGSGLGLSIVREVARLHGGEVSVRETPGGGATFRLELPADGGPARDGDGPALAPARGVLPPALPGDMPTTPRTTSAVPARPGGPSGSP